MGLRAPKPFSKAELKHVKRFVELNMGNSKCFFHSASRLSQSSKSFWLRFFFFFDSGASLSRPSGRAVEGGIVHRVGVRWVIESMIGSFCARFKFFIAVSWSLQLPIQSANRTFWWVVPVHLPDSASLVDYLLDSFRIQPANGFGTSSAKSLL